MNLVLSPVDIRVLGSLIEKEMTTPAHYPLSLNALGAACNQKSNRDPAMALDETTIVRSLDKLRYDDHLATQVTTTGSRVAKYRHEFHARYTFSGEHLALLCELFVRGPQTLGELRTRVERFNVFQDLSRVEGAMNELLQFQDGPYVVLLPREPGRREPRWAHLFGGPVSVSPESTTPAPEPARLVVMAENERIAALENQVADLTTRLETLSDRFETLVGELGSPTPRPAAAAAEKPTPPPPRQ